MDALTDFLVQFARPTGQPVRLTVYGRTFEVQWRKSNSETYKIDGTPYSFDVFKMIVQSLGCEDVVLAAIAFDIILDGHRK